MLKKIITLCGLIGLFSVSLSFAQPPNDNCANAIVANSPRNQFRLF